VAESIGAYGAPQPADVRGIASDPGLVRGARLWAVAPSHLATKSSDSLAVVSTDGHRHTVRLVLPGPGGEQVLESATVPGTGRVVLDIGKVATRPDLALLLRSDGPVVVARASVRPGLTRSHAVPG
jgi:hypothetical protein